MLKVRTEGKILASKVIGEFGNTTVLLLINLHSADKDVTDLIINFELSVIAQKVFAIIS